MSRNGSGTMTVINSFSSGDTISSSLTNANNTDFANEITNSLAIDGQSIMSGVIKAANGSASAPSYSFGSDLDTGIYRIGANEVGIGVGGSLVVNISSAGISITGALTLSVPLATANIADGAIITAKIADANVTTAKIATGGVATANLADTAVTTAKITDANVTYAKIQNVANGKVLGNFSGSAAAPSEYSTKDIRPFYHLQEQQASGTGSSNAQTAGAYNAIVLNTAVTNDIAGASLASNIITLPAGTYWVEAAMPVVLNNSNVSARSKLRLQDITNSVTKVGPGLIGYSVNVNNLTNMVTLSGRFTLSGSTNLQLQLRPEFNLIAISGPSWGDTNVFAEMKIWKEA